jgi:hypothetical protein
MSMEKLMATFATGVSRHLDFHAYQWRKHAATLSVYVWAETQVSSSLMANT